METAIETTEGVGATETVTGTVRGNAEDPGRHITDLRDAITRRTPTPQVAITERESARTGTRAGPDGMSENGTETEVIEEAGDGMTMIGHLDVIAICLMTGEGEAVAGGVDETVMPFHVVEVKSGRRAQVRHQKRKNLPRISQMSCPLPTGSDA